MDFKWMIFDDGVGLRVKEMGLVGFFLNDGFFWLGFRVIWGVGDRSIFSLRYIVFWLVHFI